MAKFIKAIFTPPVAEKRKSVREYPEHEGEGESPIGDRRKLSMSRSGRLRPSNKKRHSLSTVTGKDDMQTPEKPKCLEYHVHQPSEAKQTSRKRSIDATVPSITGSKSPEEEIDSAFEIIDKS